MKRFKLIIPILVIAIMSFALISVHADDIEYVPLRNGTAKYCPTLDYYSIVDNSELDQEDIDSLYDEDDVYYTKTYYIPFTAYDPDSPNLSVSGSSFSITYGTGHQGELYITLQFGSNYGKYHWEEGNYSNLYLYYSSWYSMQNSIGRYSVFDFEYIDINRGVYKVLNALLQFAYSADFTYAYSRGVDAVLNDPSVYGLYTSTEYNAYGSSKYTEGYNDASRAPEFSDMVYSVFDAPFKILFGTEMYDSVSHSTYRTGGLFNLNFLGVDMTAFITSVFSLAICVAILKRVL